METGTTLLIYLASVLLLTVFSGASTALEVLSLARHEKPGGGEDDSTFTDRLLDDPIPYGLGLTLARSAAMLATVWSAVALCLDRPGGLLVGAPGAVFATGAFVVVSLLVPVFLAKSVAVRDGERYLAGTRFLVAPTAYLMKPAGDLVARTIRRTRPGLLKMLSFQVIPLKDKIETFGYRNGESDEDEQRMMSSLMEFGETRVREVMVPRIDIVAVNVADDKAEAIETIIEAGHSRIPVYEDTIDRIVGTLYTKDLLRRTVSGEDFSLRELAREAFFVPESKMIDDLLAEFKARKQHLAIVVDEYGGTAGIVTLEDVLEELVGDIQDEFDIEEELIDRVDADTVVCNAKVRVDELNDELGLALPVDVAESLGGLLYDIIGRVPEVGDTRVIDGVGFEVLSVDRQRIDRVRVSGLSALGVRSEDRAGQRGE